MKQLLSVLLVIVGHSVSAQLLYPAYSDTSNANVLSLDGIGEFEATAIRRELSQTLTFGGTIDHDMKERSFDRHSNTNRLGANTNAELKYIHGKGRIFGNDSLTWLVKGGYYVTGNLNYGKDIFGLAFYGNAAFPDESLDFGGTHGGFIQFQKIGFGLLSKKNKSSVTLNIVNVQNYADMIIRTGEMRTSADASSINLSMNGTFRSTFGNQFSKGLGLALDIDYRIPTPWIKGTTATIQVLAQNLGFAHINAGLQRYEADSNWTYNGFDFSSFADGNNPVGDDFSLLDSLGVVKDTIRRSVWLPGYIQAMKMVDPDSELKLQSFFGIRFYPTFKSVPLLFAGVYWKATKFLHASASVSYGNFGNLKAGAYATLVFPRLNIMLGSDNISGLISRGGSGESFVTRLVWKLS